MNESKIKLLHVTQPTTEGVGLYVRYLVRYHDNEKFIVDVACPNNQEFINHLRKNCKAVYIIPFVRRIHPLQDLVAFFQLLKLVHENKYDVLVLHSSKAGVLGRLVGFTLGVKNIVYTPNAFAYFNNSGFIGTVYYLIERYTSWMLTKIIAVSKSELDRALEDKLVPVEKIGLVENGIDLAVLDKEINKEEKKAELKVKKDQKVVGMIARLSQQKAPEIFVEAMSDLLNEREDIYCYLAGSGPSQDTIKDLIAERGFEEKIHLLGYRDDVHELLQITDVFVLPSRYEGLPFTLLEAMAFSVPVVVTNATGNRDVIKHNENGILVEIDDVIAIKNAVSQILNDAELANTLSKNAKKTVLESYTVKQMVQKAEKVYQS